MGYVRVTTSSPMSRFVAMFCLLGAMAFVCLFGAVFAIVIAKLLAIPVDF